MGILTRVAKELTKYYFPFTWHNKPSIESPINEVHLNHMEGGINELDNRILLLAADKADTADLANVLVDFEMDGTTGVMTFTRLNGEKLAKDTAMEKIALNCYLEGDSFVLELADGTKQTVSLAKFIDTYTFESTDTIRMTVNGKNISADIPDGKIALAKLEPTVVSTIRQYTLDAQTAKGVAEQAASTAQGWAVGGTGFEDNNAKHFAGQSKRYAVITDEAPTDNAQHYCQAAEAAAEQAKAVVGFDGSADTVSAADIQGLVGAAGGASNVQALMDKIAQKVATELVSNAALATQLASYVAKVDIVQTESTRADVVPSSAYLKSVKDTLNSNLDKYNTQVTDCNAAVTPGNYILVNSANSPVTYGILKVSVGGSWIYQTVKNAIETQIPDEYIRSNINNKGWSGWTKLTTSAEYNLQQLAGMDFFIDTSSSSVGFRWLFGTNKEYGYALNISTANGGMQFYYLANGQWVPSWTK